MTAEPKSCADCGHEVAEQARFCEECGAPLRPGAAPLRAPDPVARKIIKQRSAIEGERKQVTVMFTDIVRSMELTRSLDTERWAVVLDRFLAIASGAIHGLEGTVNQFTGDGLMAVFGAPLAHEDHARRACLAVLELRRHVEAFAQELRTSEGIDFSVRCGLNSGEVIVGSIGDDLHMDFAPIGNTTSLAKRMEALAPEGSAAVSASTASLVKDELELRELGVFEVKGADRPQRVFELVGHGPARTRLEAGAIRGLSRFVGRTAERSRLEAALGRALAGQGQAVGIVGEPGVGKSRLVYEFTADCRGRGLAVTRANALAHGRAVPLLPVLAMLRDFMGIGESDEPGAARGRIERRLKMLDPAFEPDLPLVFEFLGVPDPEHPVERMDPEVRQRRLLGFVTGLVHARSRREPAILVVEDLHWMDEASAVFLDRLVEAVGGTRTLLVATFRPEYPATRFHEPAERLIRLHPLGADEGGRLLAELLGTDPSLDGLADAIQERTAGNPFFIEEMVQTLAETGRLAGERGAYCLVQPLEELVLPPSVHAVLSARIDRLDAREKTLVQMMSVIGKEVPHALLRQVGGLEEAALAGAVQLLRSGQFLVEAVTDGPQDLAFKHPLTQEVAYASQLSAARSRAHARVAAAIERLHPDGLEERAALLAHHTEAAGNRLAAAQWHTRAGIWVSTSSPAEGMRHWRRARELTDALDPSPEVLQLGVLARIMILSLAWRLGVSPEEMTQIHAEGAERLARGTEDQPATRALLDLAFGANLLTKGREREAVTVVRSLVPKASALDDPGLLVNVAGGGSFCLYLLGELGEALELTEQALTQAGDDLSCGAGLLFGDAYAFCLEQRGLVTAFMGNVARGVRDMERAIELASAHNDPEVEAYVRDLRILVGALVGDFDDADCHAERIAELSEKLGTAPTLALQAVVLAWMARGEFAPAEERALRGLAVVQERQVRLDVVPLLLTWLSQARLGLGRPGDALANAEQAAAIARGRGLKILEISAQLARARALRHTNGTGVLQRANEAVSRAQRLASAARARALEPQIHAEFAALSRLRGDEDEADREQATADRILAEITAPDATHATT